MRRVVLILLSLAVAAGAVDARAAQDPPVTDDAAYYFLIARRLENSGKPDEAVAALQKAIAIAPKSAELRAELAGVYARQDRVREALDAAEAALEHDPKNQEANRTLGSIMAALADQKRPLRPGDDPNQYLPRAITALEAARGTGTDLGLEYALGRLQLRAGRPEDAIVALQRVFDQQPEYSEGGMLLAAAQESAGKIADATRTMELTVQTNPAFFRGHVRLIELYESQQRWKEAAAAYAAARIANPKADLVAGQAAALMNAGAAREAQSLLSGALAGKSTPDASLLYLLAESQRRSGDYTSAAETAKRLRSAFPDDVRGEVMEAQIHLAQGRTNEAIAAYAALVTKVPDNPSLVYQYAQALQEADRFAEAERALRDLLARDPMDANALNSLGYMFAERGERLEEAVELLQRALKIEPGNPSYLDSLGWAYFKQGNLELADQPLSEAAAKQPANSVIQDHLGDLRARQGRFADAIVAWERALGGDGESIDRVVIEKKLRETRARVGK